MPSPVMTRAGWMTTAFEMVVGIAVLLVLAMFEPMNAPISWGLAVLIAVGVGATATPGRRQRLVMLLIPATLMTNSAVVPHGGRYVAAVTVVVALLASSWRDVGRLRPRFASLSPWIARIAIAYIAWMAVTTLFSTAKVTSASYVVGDAAVLVICFLVVPAIPDRDRLVRGLLATMVITSLCILVIGLILALAGSVVLYGKAVGLYFIAEATVLSHPTGIVFIQDYGPFEGPMATPMALGVAAAIYLRATSTGRARIGWTIAGAALVVGLLATFSREGWLITALTCLALGASGLRVSRFARPALVTGAAMVIVFLLGITSVVGVIGRMDLTTRWYGSHAASVLLNPSVVQKGEQSGTPSPAPTAPFQQRTLSHPCVAQEASGTASGDSVTLKGTTSLLARLCLWEAGLRAMVHRPLFGFGPGTGSDAIIPFFYGLSAGVMGATTHDTYIRMGVEMGIPGLMIYLALTASAAWLAWRWIRGGTSRPELVIAASVLAITVAELTDTLLFGGLSFPGFWLALSVGLLASASPRSDVPEWAARSNNGQPVATIGRDPVSVGPEASRRVGKS